MRVTIKTKHYLSIQVSRREWKCYRQGGYSSLVSNRSSDRVVCLSFSSCLSFDGSDTSSGLTSSKSLSLVKRRNKSTISSSKDSSNFAERAKYGTLKSSSRCIHPERGPNKTRVAISLATSRPNSGRKHQKQHTTARLRASIPAFGFNFFKSAAIILLKAQEHIKQLRLNSYFGRTAASRSALFPTTTISAFSATRKKSRLHMATFLKDIRQETSKNTRDASALM